MTLFAASLVGLFFSRNVPAAKQAVGGRFLVAFKDGAANIYEFPILKFIFGVTLIGTVGVLGPFNSHLPNHLYEQSEASAVEGGLALAVFAFGMLTGGIAAFVLKIRELSCALLAGATLIIVISFYVIFVSSNLLMSLCLIFVCSSSLGVISSVVPNMIEQKTDISVMGRVMNLYSMLLVIGPAIGTLLFELGTGYLDLGSIVLIYPACFAIGLFLLTILLKPSAETLVHEN